MSKVFEIEYSLINHVIVRTILHEYIQDKPELVKKFLSLSLVDDVYHAYEKLIEGDISIRDDLVKMVNSEKYRKSAISKIVGNPSLLDAINVPTREADIYVEDATPGRNFAFIWMEERIQLYKLDSKYYVSLLIYDTKWSKLFYTNENNAKRLEVYGLPAKEDTERKDLKLEQLIAMAFRDYLAEQELLR